MKSKLYTRLTMVFTAILMFTYIATSQTTISVQILDPNDDAEEIKTVVEAGTTQGDVDLGSSDLEIIFDHEPQYVGMRFMDVQIPAGATITNAYVQFQCDQPTADVLPGIFIYGVKEASTGAITEDLFSISSRPSTTATVDWAPAEWVAEGDAGEAQQTPDISAIIAEIIAVDGWAAGNSIMIVVTGDAAQTEDINREAESADGEPTGAPTLVVTFTGGGGTGVNSVSAEFSSKVYPNPTQGKLYIDNPSSDKFGYEIYSISGKLVSSRHNITGSTTEIDLSSFVKGMYFVNVRTTEKTETHKVILK